MNRSAFLIDPDDNAMTQPDTNPVEPMPAESAPASPAAATAQPSAADLAMGRMMDEQEARQARSLDRWLIVLVTLTIAGVCLLVSAGQGTKEGMRPWSPNSVLKVVVDLLNFNYAYPTPRGVAVKWLAQGFGAVAAIITAVFAWYLRARGADDRHARQTAGGTGAAAEPWSIGRIRPVTAAQIALLAFGGWALLSSQWAHFPQGAMGEAIRNSLVILWAVAIGRTMGRWGALRATAAMSGVLGLTAVLGLWYHGERNPLLRLEFPVGNPIFFAACMLPAIILGLAALAGVVEHLRGLHRQPSTSQPSVQAWSPLLIGAAALVVLIVTVWAFVLTHSRSPIVALLVAMALALAVIVTRAVSPAYRRLVLLVAVAVALAAVVLIGRPYLRAQESLGAGGRGASLRLRYHAWRYASDLFFAKPLSGHGQGGCFLLLQQMAFMPRDQWGRSDAEMDPAAFAAGMVGHVHNEWLETLADLGAIGFAFMAIALGLTLWAGLRAYMRAGESADRWCLLGLLTALAAIVIEELADVALRMPVLPIVFYTIIGLIWAMCRGIEDTRRSPSRVPERLRPVLFLVAILAAMTLVSMIRRDWRGALADGLADQCIEKQQWMPAMKYAQAAGQNRLVLEDVLSADMNLLNAAANAAAYRLGEFRDTSVRYQQATASKRGNIKLVLDDDAIQFDAYLQTVLQTGGRLWAIVPYLNSVADQIGQGLLMKAELESRKAQLGMEPAKEPFVAAAFEWFQREYRRDRFDAAAALRLLGLNPAQPIEQRVELLRIPLRGGPTPLGIEASIESALRQVLANDSAAFAQRMQALLPLAEQALTGSTRTATAPSAPVDVDRWPDPYAPETFRLQAMAARVMGDYPQAAAWSAKAVALYSSERLQFYYPTALSCGLLDHARCLFLANPEQPGPAVEACRRAVEAWPAELRRSGEHALLRRELSLYLVAAGDAGAAWDVVRDQAGDMPQDRNTGYALAELCSRFMDRVPTSRPAVFQKWLAKSVELAPDYPTSRWLAAQVALENKRGAEAVEHLKAVASMTEDRARLDYMFEQLAKRFTDSAELKAYLESRAASAPAEENEAPQSRPSSPLNGDPDAKRTGKPD
jgi:hypothetical protein